ncbi:MAG: ABC-three component system protein [Thermotogota bacterium]
MNRTKYYEYIDDKLHTLAYRIDTGGKLNMLNKHLHSENFYLFLFNLLYNFKLENLNKNQQNVEAIDLIDHENNLLIQVSATCDKQKIEEALDKDIIRDYSNYNFKFISISKDASKLRNKKINNPQSIEFDPQKDIYDIRTILNEVLNSSIEKQKNVYELIKHELGNEVDKVQLDTNLAKVINILSKENLAFDYQNPNLKSFDINEKINYNELDSTRNVIEDYANHSVLLEEKYKEFDSYGINKSFVVLQTIRKQYIELTTNNILTPDEIFKQITERLMQQVIDSANFVKIPLDVLEVCIDIIVVDAFIRCKIFENPENYNYVTTR